MTDAPTPSTTTDAGSQPAAPAPPPAAPAATTATLLTGAPATTPPATDAPPSDDAAKAAADAKAKADAEAAAKAAGAPEKYDTFTLPEGFTATPEQMNDFGTLARELNLPQANAQRLVDAHVKSMNALRESMENARAETEAEWRKTTESDKEFGGANLPANMALASKALQQFGTPELTQFLTKDSRLGDHPEILRFFVKVGKALGEDGHIQGGVTGKSKDDRELFYGESMRQKT